MEDFKQKFDIVNLTIKKVGSWIISLRPLQVTIGSLVLSLDRPCYDIGDLTDSESQELGRAFKVIKEVYAKTFSPDKVNYLLLMMVDKQVHFHVIPRYGREVIFKNNRFEDEHWPKPANVLLTLDFDDQLLLQLKEYMEAAHV
ncbi:HIT family protein [Sphingobacterium chuzhouense]|uniref:HIT family protein n=1 Tax=Sphingobacterium chuzhouense TaxID=1742264 RepID=A0ABR7XTK7_9SPHI|nr:HIT family protein [Sphingobacterium chuzhouense]MBD1422502.1 HIT family protein [Sphingobacterium chuzhouense]